MRVVPRPRLNSELAAGGVGIESTADGGTGLQSFDILRTSSWTCPSSPQVAAIEIFRRRVALGVFGNRGRIRSRLADRELDRAGSRQHARPTCRFQTLVCSGESHTERDCIPEIGQTPLKNIDPTIGADSFGNDARRTASPQNEAY